MEVIRSRKSQYLGRERINVIFRGKMQRLSRRNVSREHTLLIVPLERAKS